MFHTAGTVPCTDTRTREAIVNVISNDGKKKLGQNEDCKEVGGRRLAENN